VLARTSNKEAAEVQGARTDDGDSLTGMVLDRLRHLNAGAEPLGSFGAVVGATIGETGQDFDFNGPILAPGYGAQGGTAVDLPRIFGRALPAVLPSSSRDLLRLGPDPAAMRSAARRTNDELRALLA
jgi:orotidine-5'-phosphate decarboxylase